MNDKHCLKCKHFSKPNAYTMIYSVCSDTALFCKLSLDCVKDNKKHNCKKYKKQEYHNFLGIKWRKK